MSTQCVIVVFILIGRSQFFRVRKMLFYHPRTRSLVERREIRTSIVKRLGPAFSRSRCVRGVYTVVLCEELVCPSETTGICSQGAPFCEIYRAKLAHCTWN